MNKITADGVTFEIGKSLRASFGRGEFKKIHIVGLVDGGWVVYKWYGKHKQWWHYFVKHPSDLAFYVNWATEQKKGGK